MRKRGSASHVERVKELTQMERPYKARKGDRLNVAVSETLGDIINEQAEAHGIVRSEVIRRVLIEWAALVS